jgi:hypothetical protein
MIGPRASCSQYAVALTRNRHPKLTTTASRAETAKSGTVCQRAGA